MSLLVGCCGFAEAQKAYFEDFPVVEIQQTFYRPPQVKTARRWRAEAPEGFVFTIKAWQLITHQPDSPTYRRLGRTIPEEETDRYGSFRPTEEVLAAWRTTREIAAALGAAVIVFQCPARFTSDREHIDHLRRFFSAIDRDGFLLAWEPRGDWPADAVRGLCAELDLIHCVDPFKSRCLTKGPVYFRLHGRTGYRYRYTAEDLRELQTLGAKEEGFVLFNNMTMKEDALRFLGLLSAGEQRR